MSDSTNMRRLLGSKGGLSSPLSSDEHDALLAGHIEAVSHDSSRELQLCDDALQGVLAQSEPSRRERTGQTVLRSLRSIRPLSSVQAPSYEEVAATELDCVYLDPPRFAIRSAEQLARNSAGKVVRFARADASARTLEVTAATGEFGGIRWPSSETFIFGFNRSQASIGGILTIPPMAKAQYSTSGWSFAWSTYSSAEVQLLERPHPCCIPFEGMATCLSGVRLSAGAMPVSVSMGPKEALERRERLSRSG